MNSIHKEMIAREQVAKDEQTFRDVFWTGIGILIIAGLTLVLGGF